MIRLAVRCDPGQAELVLAELTVLAPGGVEESAGEGFVEYAIYGAAGELPELGLLEAASGDGLVSVESTEVADDWSERWRAFHRPLEVSGSESGSSIWLRPPWEPERPEAFEVVIDPGQAFGTGAHPTTRLSLELLLDQFDRHRDADDQPVPGPLTDLGAGSGVLAIAAARLGFSPVSGYDHESTAIAAANENAAANGVAPAFTRHDLRRGLPPLAPLVVANLTAPLLEIVAAQLRQDNRPERMICSGLLDAEEDRVVAAFAPAGLAASEFRSLDGWGGLLLEAG